MRAYDPPVTAMRSLVKVRIADDSAVPCLIFEQELASLASETAAAIDGQEARGRFLTFQSEVVRSDRSMAGVAFEHALKAA